MADIKKVLKKNGWHFNWRNEYKQEARDIFKMFIVGDSTIQGLISLQAADNFIEMHLLETAPHNFGGTKMNLGVAGNLVAFACKMSFEKGYDEFVSFTAKTALIQHYRDSLGAEVVFRNRMAISDLSARNLVNSYFKAKADGQKKV